ncbi:MAG: hypothetical protein WDN46_20745 [Methylocella sp.]
MFTPAFAQVISVVGGKMDLIALIYFALIVGLTYFVIIRPLRKRARKNAHLISTAAPVRKSKEVKATSPPTPGQNSASLKGGATTVEDDMDIASLMSAVRDQAVELRCEHAKVVSNLSLNFDVLTNRLSTIEPLLAKMMEAASKSEASVGLLTLSNDEYKQRLSEAERDLALYQPLAVKLESDLRIARNRLAETDRKFVALETDYAKAQSASNDLFQKKSSAEMARQRATEENVALAQKLNEHEFTIQSLLRETAQLKSETVSVASDFERSELESKSVADKYAAELEGNSRAKAALDSLQTEFNQFRKDSAAQTEQAEERERALTAALSVKEKQFYDSEIKRSALDSKIDFLTRTNQRLREDLRRHLDHIGNLEASNRKLFDLLARNSIAEDQDTEAKGAATAARVTPKLRAVPDSQTGNNGPAKSTPLDRA